jgi:hypothetical protein
MKRETRFKQPTDKIKKRLDGKFSKYARLSRAVNETCTCVTCGRPFHWKDCDAGHFHRRGLIWLRYDIRNVWPQCTNCNRRHDGKLNLFAGFILKELGQETMLELDQLAYKQDLRTSVDRKEWLLDIEDDVDEKLKGL